MAYGAAHFKLYHHRSVPEALLEVGEFPAEVIAPLDHLIHGRFRHQATLFQNDHDVGVFEG